MAAIRPALVGGFILGALALGVGGILFFGGTRLFVGTSTAVVFFDGSVAGLDVGASVTFRGVRIGSVTRIALSSDTRSLTARIPVFLEIEPDRITWAGGKPKDSEAVNRRLVDLGLRAQLVSQSFLTGQVSVDLDFRPGTPVVLIGAVEGVPEIPSVPSDDLHRLQTELTELPLRTLVETAQHTLVTVGQLAAQMNAALDPLVASARRSTDAATHTFETTDESVRRVQEDASATLHELNVLMADARHQLDARGAELGRTLATSDRAARQAEMLLTEFNTMAAPRSQFRGDLEATARDLADSANSLRSFARTLERNPSAVLTGKTVP
jgi:paraquat-inducible protein B